MLFREGQEKGVMLGDSVCCKAAVKQHLSVTAVKEMGTRWVNSPLHNANKVCDSGWTAGGLTGRGWALGHFNRLSPSHLGRNCPWAYLLAMTLVFSVHPWCCSVLLTGSGTPSLVLLLWCSSPPKSNPFLLGCYCKSMPCLDVFKVVQHASGTKHKYQRNLSMVLSLFERTKANTNNLTKLSLSGGQGIIAPMLSRSISSTGD